MAPKKLKTDLQSMRIPTGQSKLRFLIQGKGKATLSHLQSSIMIHTYGLLKTKFKVSNYLQVYQGLKLALVGKGSVKKNETIPRKFILYHKTATANSHRMRHLTFHNVFKSHIKGRNTQALLLAFEEPYKGASLCIFFADDGEFQW